MAQNYFEDAIPLLESGLKIAPQRADLHAALGESYFMTDRVEKAVEEFKVLVGLDPSAPSYAALGLSYRHLGRFDEARKIFRRASSSIPTTRPACSTWATSKSGRAIRRPPNDSFSRPSSRIRIFPKRFWNWPIYESRTRNLRKPQLCSDDT